MRARELDTEAKCGFADSLLTSLFSMEVSEKAKDVVTVLAMIILMKQDRE